MTSKPKPAVAAGIVAVVIAVTIIAVVKRPQPAPEVQEVAEVSPTEPDVQEVAEASPTEPEDQEVAEVSPTEPEVSVSQVEEPTVQPEESEPVATPTFDLVRVETDGSAVVAGTAEPGSTVRVLLGEDTVETVKADASGSFVALMQLPEGPEPQPMVLEQVATGGQVIPSEESVLVVPRTGEQSLQPIIVIADPQGAILLQPEPAKVPVAETQSASVSVATGEAEPAQQESAEPQAFALSLDTISYDQDGDVVLAGRGPSDRFVRIYINNKPVETEAVPSDGQWQVKLPTVEEGVHTLRVDEIDAAGSVVSRVESPFKRETPAAAAAAAAESPLKSSVTVQPGHTLWALALTQYGDGIKYVQIFDANRDAIRNPDLIYPGQVFELPK
ncbi:MAG: LysM peptidoglycan-binding domain-containing protein [Rhodobacteraceae bacterium]|nr:LysM peptidoglycan-binding domain-containing protein [Paracoccaceae bacterium]